MSDPWVMFGVVVLIYLSDCFVWHASGQWVFSGTPGRCVPRNEPSVRVGWSGGLSLAPAIPPMRPFFRADGADWDAAAALKRLDRWHAETRALCAGAEALFVVLLGGAAVLCWFDAWSAFGLMWAAAAVPLWFACVALAMIATVRLHNVDWRGACARCAMLLLSPLSAIRALDRVTEGLFASYHPVVVSYVCCSTSEFRRVARLVWFDEPPHSAARTRIETFLDTVGQFDALIEAPAPDDGAEGFCPRCWVQYRAIEVACTDCGVELRPFSVTRQIGAPRRSASAAS